MGQRVSSYFPRNSDKTSEETAYPLVVKAPERERDRSYATIESRKNQADKAIPCCKRGRLAILPWNPGTSFPAMEPGTSFPVVNSTRPLPVPPNPRERQALGRRVPCAITRCAITRCTTFEWNNETDRLDIRRSNKFDFRYIFA